MNKAIDKNSIKILINVIKQKNLLYQIWDFFKALSYN
jgi:hypothetical protein